MTTLRIYTNGKRVATGKPWKDLFLQVYPILKEFNSVEEWQKSWDPTRKSIIPPLAKTKWTYTKELSFTAPAGIYYIGDLCYALHEEVYDDVFGGEGYSSGLYTMGKSGRSSFFLVDGTSGGDGTFEGTDGFSYMVDAGIIGICSHDLIDYDYSSLDGGNIHVFKEPVSCIFKDGLFRFQSGKTRFEIQT